MNGKGQYKTKQRDEIITFLQSVPGTHVTVHDICEHLKAQGCAIGTTTVYRQLERMVDEGLVSKYVIDASSPACFEYTGAVEHTPQTVCFHCKCVQCGRLIHLHCDALSNVRQHMLDEHGFALDLLRTVLYGVCEDCRQTPAR